MNTLVRGAALLLALAFLALTVVNASWIAQAPRGKVKLVAHRGVAPALRPQSIQDNTPCPSAQIDPPMHKYLPNTLASLRQAKSSGAAMIQLDVARSSDGFLVAFDRSNFACITGSQRSIGETSFEEVAGRDAGFGYTPDSGKTFPLRSKGQGAIAKLGLLVQNASRKPLLFNLEGASASEAEQLVKLIKSLGRDPVKRRDGFYAASDSEALRLVSRAFPEAWTFSQEAALACSDAYRLQGWIGLTPSVCRQNTLIIPLDQQWAFAGWPNRLIARMEAVDARIIITVTRPDEGMMRGIDLPEQLGEIPRSFNGYVWVDDIWNIGPALFPSIERRTAEQQIAAQEALDKRRAR